MTSIVAENFPIRVKNCRHGLFMYNVNDEFVGRSLDVYGEFSEAEASFFARLVKPGMTVVDIGANIGAHTIGLAKQVTPAGAVIAFEPQRIMYQLLCGNIALNGLDNVSTHQVALGKATGSITVPPVNYRQRNNFGGVELGVTADGEAVPLLTLDSFNLQRCNFIKLDVEGMEKTVLEGATQTLASCNPILYVENDRLDKSEALIRFLLDAGYRLYWHLPMLFNPGNYFARSENIFPTLVSFNMLGLPRALSHVNVQGYEEITCDNAAHHPMTHR